MSTLPGAISLFRRRREAMFQAEGRVTRSTGDGTFDENTGAITPPAPTVVYEGPCDVRERRWAGTDVVVGSREVRLESPELTFPHDTPIREDDVLTVTACDQDPDIIGRVYRISDVSLDTWQVVRKAIGERIARGATP